MSNEAAERNVPQVYTLTRLTRSAGQSRRVVVAGFDVPMRGLIVTVLAVAIAFLPTLILWIFVGSWALIVPLISVGAAFYLVETRARSGLHLRTYQVMIDKRRASIGRFVCCGRTVEPRMTGYALILRASMPSPYLADLDEVTQTLLASRLAGATPFGGISPQGPHRAPRRLAYRPRSAGRKASGGDPFAELARESAPHAAKES